MFYQSKPSHMIKTICDAVMMNERYTLSRAGDLQLRPASKTVLFY
jgi:hypothetical protein